LLFFSGDVIVTSVSNSALWNIFNTWQLYISL
jgi:hypothetical protein